MCTWAPSWYYDFNAGFLTYCVFFFCGGRCFGAVKSSAQLAGVRARMWVMLSLGILQTYWGLWQQGGGYINPRTGKQWDVNLGFGFLASFTYTLKIVRLRKS